MSYILQDIEDKVNSIPRAYRSALDLLKRQEGGILHRNSNENDITNGYGIYRYAHPEAVVFNYIVQIANSLGITSPSSSWTREQINNIQSRMDPKHDLYYSYLFYKDFYKSIDLSNFHNVMIPVVVSLYANSPKICVKSLQMGYNKLVKDGLVNGNALTEDGVNGPGTMGALKVFVDWDEGARALKMKTLDSAIENYTKLANSSPDKYMRYLKGWINRVNSLK